MCKLFQLLHTSSVEHFLRKDPYLKVQVCQRINLSKMAPKLRKQSMPDVFSVILDYKDTREAELIGKLTIIVIIV